MPLLNTLGAFNAQNKTGYGLTPHSSYYVNYMNPANVDEITYPVANTSNQTVCIDSSGNTYIATYNITDTGITYYITLTKLDSTGAIVLTKQINPNSSNSVNSVCMTIDGSTLYLAFNVNFSTTYQFYLLSFDTSFNINWQTAYSKTNTGGNKVFVAKHPTQSYLYAMHGTNSFYIFNTSGTLQNAYSSSSWSLPGGTIGGNSGPFFANSTTKIGSQTSNITLGAGYNTVTSVSARTLTTSNVTIQNSTYNQTDGYIYGIYYNSSSTISGIYKYDFTGTILLKYEYTFSEGYPISFTGITTDGTYLYVSAASTTDPVPRSYMFKFDTSLNYVDGYKISSTGGNSFNLPFLKPLYYSGKTYTVGGQSQWVLPSNFSTPSNGVYFVNGIEFDKDIVSTPTRTTGTLAFSTSSPAITTISPTLLSISITPTTTSGQFIFVGL